MGEEILLITGRKYDRVVRLVLMFFIAMVAGGVIFALSGGKIVSKDVQKPTVVQVVSEITTEELAKSNLGNKVYLVIARAGGEYAFVQIQNSTIENDKALGYSELVYQNGEAKLTQEVNGMIDLYDSNNRVVETDQVVFHGVTGITLSDGSTFPVKIINGRVSGGRLVGDTELWSLKDNSRILGTFDTRGQFKNIQISPSLREVDTASAIIGKEAVKWLSQVQEKQALSLPGVIPVPTPTPISGAVTIDPITGLAIINSGVVGDAQIVNGSITNLKIGDSAVTTTKLSDLSVTTAKIVDSALTGAKIADGTIADADISGSASISDGKLATITSSGKVAGTAVELKSGGGLTHGSGLTLLTTCSVDQVLAWDSDSWECKSVGGVGTGLSSLNSLTGALSITGSGFNTVTASGTSIDIAGVLPALGTAGTYGSSTDIPVLTTDANGRVSGVTSTAISGLTSSALSASAGITNAQLSNSSIYVSAGSGVSISGSPVSLGGTVTIGMADASTTVKGAASFNSTNFSVVSGAVNTVQNIDSTAAPTFNSLTLTRVNNQLVLGTTNTTTITSTAPSASRVATIPALTASDEFVFKNQSQTLSGKTLDAGSNTITGLTNSNLSGTAGITDANLATITTANKVSGSAVQLNANGGISNSSGLTLLTSCSSNQILKWNGSAWACAADSTGGTPSVYTDGGLLSDGTGLSLIRTCSDNRVLKWTAVSGWTCQADSTGGGSVTITESDGSPSVGSVTTLQFGPASTSSDEFVVSDQTGGIARVRTGTKVVLTDASQALTNKTIDASLNTISNIADSSLATISTANKVSGSAVQLSANGGLVNNSGLSLLTTCNSGEILKWNGSAWACNSSGTSLDGITAAIGASSIANGENAQTWNWALSTAAKTAFTFGETTASIGVGSYILNARTLSSSTAAPLGVFARTYPIIDTTAAGGVTIGNATLAQAVTVDSGAGAINIGNSATGKTITIGSATGTGALNMYAGTGNVVLDGAGGTTYSFGSSTTTGTFTMGGSAQTGTANLFTGTGAMTLNIGTGASAKAISLGNSDTTTSVTINSGTGGITLMTGTTGNLSLKTGTTGTVTLDSGTTGAVSVGTGANAKAITIGSATSGTTLSLTGGTTWSLSTAGTLTTSGNISLTSTTPTISVGNTGTLSFTDGTNTLLSVVDKGTYATLRLSDKGSTGDPATCNAGEIYFNDTDNTVKACTSANTWEQLDNGADAQAFATYDTSEALTNVTTAETQIATLSVTPSTTTGDVYVRGLMEIVSGNNTNHTITFTVEKGGTTCADSTVLETNTIAITSANGVTIGAFELADIDVDPGTTAVTYRLCSITSAVDSDVRLYSFMAMVVDNGADLAEIYSTSDESLQAGDLVSLDPLLSVGVKKSSEKYDRALFGVVSTWPGMVIGGSNGEGVKAIPVALSGRVPVKVNTENGDIKAGDLLTSSSTPGVAMKASKAGSVIAQAMTNYSGDEAGTVLAFIKNGGSNGATLAEVMSGLDQTSGTYSFDVLTNIILQKDQINTDSTNISEIFTDRVVAGLEIITPKITTENLLVKGEATFSGILYADTIKANRIEGVDILTRKLSLLSDQVAGVATSAGEVQEILTETNILEIISSKIAEVFMNMVEFLGKVVFRGDVNFAGRPTFNKDTAGFATIKAGGSEVEVLFAREYATEPVVTATVQIAGGASVADVPGYAIADVNTRGFMIRMSRGVGMDLRFAWMALAVSGTSVFEGDGGVVITTTPTQAPESTPEPVVSISPETTPEIPEATPAAIVVPTPTSIPEITPTEEASKSGDL